MSKVEEKWPTRRLKSAIERYFIGSSINMALMGCESIQDQHEAQAIIAKFAPRVCIAGVGLVFEKLTA